MAEPVQEYWPITGTYRLTMEQREWALVELERRLKAEAAALDARAERVLRARALCDERWDLAAVRRIARVLDGDE